MSWVVRIASTLSKGGGVFNFQVENEDGSYSPFFVMLEDTTYASFKVKG